MTSDIPNELKLLIRMLLSVDPNKRPSCNEILTKLKSLRRDSNAHIFQDIPTEWQPNASSSASAAASTSTKRSFTNSTSPVSIPEEMDIDNDEIILEEDQIVDSNPINIVESSIRKRQRLLGGDEQNDDIRMTEINEPDENSQLLIASPDIVPHEGARSWLTDYQTTQLIKTITVVLKVNYISVYSHLY